MHNSLISTTTCLAFLLPFSSSFSRQNIIASDGLRRTRNLVGVASTFSSNNNNGDSRRKLIAVSESSLVFFVRCSRSSRESFISFVENGRKPQARQQASRLYALERRRDDENDDDDNDVPGRESHNENYRNNDDNNRRRNATKYSNNNEVTPKTIRNQRQQQQQQQQQTQKWERFKVGDEDGRDKTDRVKTNQSTVSDGVNDDDEDDNNNNNNAKTAPSNVVEDASIDSFLRGEYDRPFADDAPGPHPGLGPGDTVDVALRALRKMDEPELSHGAAVFMRFCAPLSRGERWGGGTTSDPWKEVLRGAITPTMLARRLRASEFSCLLDWERLDVTEGYSLPSTRKELGVGMTVAFVNAALFFGDGIEPTIVQFKLRKLAGVWLVDTAIISKKELFVDDEDTEQKSSPV